jgi:hypothetical protein
MRPSNIIRSASPSPQVFWAFLVGFLLITRSASAIVLDWSSYNPVWTHSGGVYTTSINFDSTNPGNDVTITISGDTGEFLTGYPYNSPGVNSIITGGEGSSEESLLLAFNWNSRNDSVTVTFDFNYANGIQNLEFTLFDIDRLDNNTANSGFRDYISDITGSYNGGGNIVPTITVEDNDYTTVQNSGKSTQGIRGEDGVADNSDNGNAYISFGTNVVDQISFTYGNWTGSGGKAPSDPGQQGIGIYDLTFDKKSKVPEVGPALVASTLCALAVLYACARERLQRTTCG